MKNDSTTLINAWRTAQTKATEARAEHTTRREAAEAKRRGYEPVDPASRLLVIALEIDALEKEDATLVVGAAATVALDTEERAVGDELALACCPAALADGLSVALEEEARMRVELGSAVQRIVSCIASARAAQVSLAARRSAAGLPPPARLPNPQLTGPGTIGPALPMTLLERLRRYVIEGAPPVTNNSERIQRLQEEAIETAAGLEHARLEAEEIKEAEARL